MSKKYKIAKSTINNKLYGDSDKTVGRPCVFSTEEENTFVAHLIKLCEFGFSVTEVEDVHFFKANEPGKTCLLLFLFDQEIFI